MKNLFAVVLIIIFTASLPAVAKPEQSVLRDYVHYVHLKITIKAQTDPDASSPRFSAVLPQNAPPQDRRASRDFTGSAVVIAPGYAVSAWHVFEALELSAQEVPPNMVIVDLQSTASPRGKFDNRFPVKVVAKDIPNDLVLIEGDFKCPCAPIASGEPILDEVVYNVGYPLFQHHEVQIVTKGEYQGRTSSNFYMITAQVTSGASGGGSFQKDPADGKWKLMGIISGVTTASVGNPRAGLQIQVNWLSISVPIHPIHALVKGTSAATFIIGE
jgi:S1-C subfamily serine protease